MAAGPAGAARAGRAAIRRQQVAQQKTRAGTPARVRLKVDEGRSPDYILAQFSDRHRMPSTQPFIFMVAPEIDAEPE